MSAPHEDLPLLFASGGLAADERASFEAHLPVCRACREALDLAGWGSSLAAAGALRPSRAGLERAIRKALAAEEEARPLGGFAPALMGLALAGVVLFLMARSPLAPPERAASPVHEDWLPAFDSEVRDLQARIAALDRSLGSREPDPWPADFDRLQRDLDQRREWLERELSGDS